VVVTHHVPTHQCEHLQYKGSLLSPGFVTELGGFIADTQPNYWIYGHSHANMPPVHIDQTTLLTNQLGYVSMGEHVDYRHDACFTI
jgi:hypothetical protein